MDNTTILAIAVLAAVLVYFLILRKPNPPTPPPKPPHPVEKRCVIDYLNLESQIKNQATSMLTFYVLFVNKYGPTPMNEDPVYLSLANILLATNAKKKLGVCKSYQEMGTLVNLFLKNAEIWHPEQNKNLATMMEPAHKDDLAKYVMYIDFFEKLAYPINIGEIDCCGR